MSGKKIQNKQRFVYPDEALRNFFVKRLIWHDNATRSEYWWVVLVLSIVSFTSLFFVPILGLLFVLLALIPMLALTARRWNDLGYNGTKLTIFELLLIPICFVFLLLCTVFPEWVFFLIGNPIGLCKSVIWVFGIVKLIFFCMPSKTKRKQHITKRQHTSTTKNSSYYYED